MKYVVFEHFKALRLIEVDKAVFTPAGWHRPYNYYTLDNLSKAKLNPSQKCGDRVTLPGYITSAKNVRLVDDTTCLEIDEIDDHILALRKKRHALIVERHRTFPLVNEHNLKRSHEEVFPTKKAAEDRNKKQTVKRL